MDFFWPPGQKKVAVVERWWLVEVRLYVRSVLNVFDACLVKLELS